MQEVVEGLEERYAREYDEASIAVSQLGEGEDSQGEEDEDAPYNPENEAEESSEGGEVAEEEPVESLVDARELVL